MYYLSAHAHCVEFREGAILLDLRTGCYLGFDAATLPHLQSAVANWRSPSPSSSSSGVQTHAVSAHTVIEDLLARGILTSLEPKERRPYLAPPLTSISMPSYPAALGSVPVRHLFSFLLALLHVPLRVRRNKLMPLLGWLDARQYLIDSHTMDLQTLRALISSFHQLRIWFYTAHNHCLFDSLLLSTFLTLHKIPCTFVISVASKPFLAHAWVQIGDMILNDTAEHAQEFLPLLTAGSSA